MDSRSLDATGGGAAALYGSALTLCNGTAVRGCSSLLGGAAAASQGSTLLLDGAAVTNCSASFGGGAAALAGSSLSLVNGASIDGTAADEDGGCAFAYRLSNVSLAAGTRCANARAGGSGGGVAALYSESVRVDGAQISGCRAGESAGALHLRHSAGWLTAGALLSNNSAPAGSGGGFTVVGGAGAAPWCAGLPICSSASLSCASSAITANSCGQSGGGGIVYRTGAVSVNGCSFYGNRAADAGGALLVDSLGRGTNISNADFDSNRANSCGAFQVLNADDLQLRGTRVANNAAVLNVVVEHGEGLGVFGEGGGACVAQSPEVQTRYTCLNGATLDLASPSGSLSVVQPGSLLLSTEQYTCRWALTAPPQCAVELTLSAVFWDQQGSIDSTLAVSDATTGAQFFAAQGRPAAGRPLPLTFRSNSSRGIVVSFNASSRGDDGFFETGFAASFRRLCTVGNTSVRTAARPEG